MSGPRRQKQCDRAVTAGGATYECSRPDGHAGSHQCIGQEHPADGETYMLTWDGPEKLMGAR